MKLTNLCTFVAGACIAHTVHYFTKAFCSRKRSTITAPASEINHLRKYNQLETIFHTIPDAVCVLNRNFEIVNANKSYASFVESPLHEVIGKRCHGLLHQSDYQCKRCPVCSTFSTGDPVQRWRGKRIHSKDEVTFYEISTLPIKDDNGTISYVVEFIRNVTDEKRMLEQLIRSEKLASIGIMTAGIAHEINNPLSGISGTSVNMLQMPEKYGLNEKGIRRVTTILKSAGRATGIMRDLLDFSRKHENVYIEIDINALVKKTTNAVYLHGASCIKRTYDLDHSLPPVICNPSKIEQVLINIVTNGIQSIQERQGSEPPDFRGEIITTTRHKDNEVTICIADNGKGIPEKLRSKIFDPFFSTRPTGQGTGLGLSICHRIIDEHGGRLYFENKNDHTRFSIVLPVRPAKTIEQDIR